MAPLNPANLASLATQLTAAVRPSSAAGQTASAIAPATPRAPGASPGRGADTVDVSAAARERISPAAIGDNALTGPVIRHDLVQRVRTEIDSGGYLTNERLDLALGRMIQDYTSWLR